ncbi:hypothetical protein EV182_006676, partial [Spiromyces aspiralis]
SDGAALPRKRPRSSTTNSTGSNRASARVTGDVVSVSTNNLIRLVRENKLLVDKTDLLLDIMKDDSPVYRFVNSTDGGPVMIDYLLSGEYSTFTMITECTFKAHDGWSITAETHRSVYRMALWKILSMFLDSSKYDVAREVATNQGKADIVIKPSHGAAGDGSGRGSLGVLVEVKRADPDTVDEESRSLTDDDVMFIKDESEDRMERACRKLGDKTFRSLRRLLTKGYNQILKNKYLSIFNGCCDEVLVIVASFSGGRCLFQFEYFKRQAEDWCLDSERHPIVDYLACPYNWPDL